MKIAPENHTGEDGFEEFLTEQFPAGTKVTVEANGVFFYATVVAHNPIPERTL